MSLLEPWILSRIAAGTVSAWLLLYAALVGLRVLRHGGVGGATEGRLLLERQAELAATAARIGGFVQVLALLLSALAADRLSHGLRGAMCGYGVVHANGWGVLAMGTSVTTALAGAVFAGLLRFESGLATPLFRVVALASLPLAALASLDLVLTATWLGSLDFSVVASCCSTSLDGASSPAAVLGASGRGRLPVALSAAALVAATALLAGRSRRTAGRRRLVLVAALAALAVPFGLAAIILEVSPHVYEAPQHLCVYCLLRLDALAIGYPLVFALVLGAASAISAGVAALVAPRTRDGDEVLSPFARRGLHRTAVAFGLLLVLGLAPIVRFTVLSGGRSLFP